MSMALATIAWRKAPHDFFSLSVMLKASLTSSKANCFLAVASCPAEVLALAADLPCPLVLDEEAMLSAECWNCGWAVLARVLRLLTKKLMRGLLFAWTEVLMLRVIWLACLRHESWRHLTNGNVYSSVTLVSRPAQGTCSWEWSQHLLSKAAQICLDVVLIRQGFLICLSGYTMDLRSNIHPSNIACTKLYRCRSAMTLVTLQYLQPLGHSIQIWPSFLYTSSVRRWKPVHSLLNKSLCFNMSLGPDGLRKLMFCQGDPPVHGIAENNNIGICLGVLRTSCMRESMTVTLVASVCSVTRITRQSLDHKCCWPILELGPQQYSMMILLCLPVAVPPCLNTAGEIVPLAFATPIPSSVGK